MRKFLTISVCMFVSLMANAGVKVESLDYGDTKADSITIDGNFTDADLEKLKLEYTSVKIATGDYKLTKDEWKSICDKIIYDRGISRIDFTNTKFDYALEASDYSQLIQGSNGVTKVSKITFSRYADIPAGSFNIGDAANQIVEINVPDKKYKENTEITIGGSAFHALKGLKTLYIGSSVKALGEAFCENCYALSSVTFNAPSIKELPKSSFNQCSSLSMIDLPNNLEIVGDQAFDHCNLATVTFPNTLTTIKTRAFEYCNLKYIVIPENVTSIEREAFQQNANLTDVYVMGNDVKCAADGFTNAQISGGFNNTTTGKDEDHPAKREDWTKNDGTKLHPIVLHIVTTDKESEKKYHNSYWTMLNTPGILDELKTYENKSNDEKDEFCKKYNLHKNEFPWSLYYYALDPTKECPFAYYQYVDDNNETKTCKIWRSDNGYYSQGDSYPDQDHAGWQMFLLVQDDAKHNTFEDVRRIDDKWYSMCFPFDMTATQIRTAYGAGTEVCEFIGVWKTNEVVDGRNKYEFRFKPLLSADKARSSEEPITKANRSYMIHPASKLENAGSIFSRIIPDIPAEEQVMNQDLIIPTIPESDFGVNELMSEFAETGEVLIEGYKFVGNYKENTTVPLGCYYFAYKKNEDTRTLILNHITKETSNLWKPMNAIVIYSGKGNGTNSNAAKTCFSFSPFKKSSETTTGIQEVTTTSINAKKTNNNLIYTLSGQVVKEGNSLEGLPKGIYIVNGKKVIVK